MVKNIKYNKREVAGVYVGIMAGLGLGLVSNLFIMAAYEQLTQTFISREWILAISGICLLLLILLFGKKINNLLDS